MGVLVKLSNVYGHLKVSIHKTCTQDPPAQFISLEILRSEVQQAKARPNARTREQDGTQTNQSVGTKWKTDHFGFKKNKAEEQTKDVVSR